MKSPTINTEALNYALLERSTFRSGYQQIVSKKGRRRKSRKNLLIFTVMYALVITSLLFLLF